MKSERRHELQHNMLADWLAQTAESLKPYQNIILAGAVLVLVLVAVYTWWSHESEALTRHAWDEFNTALESGNPTALAKVTEDLPGTPVADLAAVVSADYHLGEGCRELFSNKATAQQELTKAIELYNTIRDRSRVPSLLERATFGLARAKESKGDATNIEQAMQRYEEVVAKWPNGAYAAAAGQRLEDLKKPATKELYDRFARFDPKPAFSSESGGKLPFDASSLPKESPPSAAAADAKPGSDAAEGARTPEESDAKRP